MGLPKAVNIGAPFTDFPGGSFNALVAGYWAHRGQRVSSAQADKVLCTSGPSLICKIKNGTGQNLNPGQVLGIHGPMINYPAHKRQVYSRPMFNGLAPQADEPNKFVILTEQIRDGKPGSAVLIGAAWAQVDVADVGHKFAKIKDLETQYLESGGEGAQIIYKEKQGESGSQALGVQWVLIIMGGGAGGGNVPRALCIATAEIPARSGSTPGTSGSYNIIKGDVSGNIENWSLVPISAGSYMVILDIGGSEVIVSAFC